MLNNLIIKVFLNDDRKTQIADINGLFLIKQKRAIKWYSRFKHMGVLYQKELGEYPNLSLAEARIKNKALKQDIIENPSLTVKQAAEIWLEKKKSEVIDFDNLKYKINKYIIKAFGGVELEKLTAPMVIEAWKVHEYEQRMYTLKICSNYLAKIAKLMINIGKVKQTNNIFNISSYYVRGKVTHRATIDPGHLADFFTAYFSKRKVFSQSYTLLKLSFFTLLRQQELIYMNWDWIRGPVIEIPAEVMKMKRPFRVPLTTQIVRELNAIPKISHLVFPAAWDSSKQRTLNKETLTKSLNKLGFQNILSAHGIRAVGSTWLAKQNFKKEFREACLAHKTGNVVELTYQNYDFIQERAIIMQEWCNYVDKCINEGKTRAATGEVITDLYRLKEPPLELFNNSMTLESLKIS